MPELWFLLFALLAEIAGTMAGFGSSTILLPIALFMFDFPTALVLVAIAHVSGGIGRIAFFRYGLNKRLLLIFGLPSVIFTVIGAILVNYAPQPLLKLILGIFLLIYSIISLYKPNLSAKPTTANSIVGGTLSGFFAGLIGTGGALRGAFLTAFKLEKSVYIATAAAIALAVDVTRIPIYVKSGFLSSGLYYLIPLIFFAAIIGSFIGKRIVSRIPQDTFRKVVLIAIGMVSLKFIYDGIVAFILLY